MSSDKSEEKVENIKYMIGYHIVMFILFCILNHFYGENKAYGILLIGNFTFIVVAFLGFAILLCKAKYDQSQVQETPENEEKLLLPI